MENKLEALMSKLKLLGAKNIYNLFDCSIAIMDNNTGEISDNMEYRVDNIAIYCIQDGKIVETKYRHFVYNIDEGVGAGIVGDSDLVDILDSKLRKIIQIQINNINSIITITNTYLAAKISNLGRNRIINNLYEYTNTGYKITLSDFTDYVGYKDFMTVRSDRELDGIMIISGKEGNKRTKFIEVELGEYYTNLCADFMYGGIRCTGVMFYMGGFDYCRIRAEDTEKVVKIEDIAGLYIISSNEKWKRYQQLKAITGQDRLIADPTTKLGFYKVKKIQLFK